MSPSPLRASDCCLQFYRRRLGRRLGRRSTLPALVFAPDLLQVRDQIAHRLVAQRGFFFQAFSYQLLLVAAAVAETGAVDRRRFRGEDGGDDFCRTLRLEGPPPAQQFIKHRTEAEDISAAIPFFASHLLG